jgi:Ca2+-binding EF-hand superfamily protein
VEYVYISTNSRCRPHDQKIDVFFSENDSDKDGFLSFSDFRNFYHQSSISKPGTVQ